MWCGEIQKFKLRPKGLLAEIQKFNNFESLPKDLCRYRDSCSMVLVIPFKSLSR